MKIASCIFIFGGIILCTAFSIKDFLRSRLMEVKENHEKKKEEKEQKQEIEDEKKVKISNGNEIEETEKLTIKSVDDIKKALQEEINLAKNNASIYGTGNDRNITKVPVELVNTNVTAITENERTVIGPFRINQINNTDFR